MSGALAAPAALPRLTRALAASPALAGRGDVSVPAAELLVLPERAVQFGTGAFLRGFVDFFVDAANRAGTFGGRVVAVGSTGSGRDATMAAQDGLYTLVSRGLVDGVAQQDARIIGSVSRALSATTDWPAVLELARSPQLALVFSNTTEVGIALDEGDAPELAPPRSFPGKLTRFLHERATAFDHDPARGLVVLPCELIEANGARLREIVLALAGRWGYAPAFAAWVRDAVTFCDTLVDRIVPGAPSAEEGARLQASLGYADAMLTTCEEYRLFVIQADPTRRADHARLLTALADADPGVVLAPDVAPYRERKVRLLNGTHTAMVAAALLAGFETVREAVTDPQFGAFVRRLLLDEIAPTVDAPGTDAFAREVLDRFANPFVRHALVDITLQGTMKMRVRVVPTVVRHGARTGDAPAAHALGFAAYLLFMRGDLQARRRAAGLPVPADDGGARLHALWAATRDPSDDALRALARAACADVELWGADLARVPGFADAVGAHLVRLVRDGMPAALRAVPAATAAR